MIRVPALTPLSLVLLAGVIGTTSTPTTAQAQAADPITRHVIVISIDGLRPDAIARFRMSTLERLMSEGAVADDAQTVLPSKTLPSHTSMLTGVTPDVHGITFNTEIPDLGIVTVPTVFELARAEGWRTAAFYSKAKLRHLDRPDSYDYRQAPASNIDNWMATRTVADAARYLRHERPNLLFVHIAEPDYAGHTMGWMSTFYGWAVRRADGAVARLLEAADDTYGAGRYTVIVTADHGGHETGHGEDTPEERTIPWIAWGQGVLQGATPMGVRTMDTAATVLWLLEVEVPADWSGRPVVSAFGSAALAAPGR